MGEPRPGRQSRTLLVCGISSKVQLFPCSVNMFSEGKWGKNLNNSYKENYRLGSLGPMVISCIFPAVLWQQQFSLQLDRVASDHPWGSESQQKTLSYNPKWCFIKHGMVNLKRALLSLRIPLQLWAVFPYLVNWHARSLICVCQGKLLQLSTFPGILKHISDQRCPSPSSCAFYQ